MGEPTVTQSSKSLLRNVPEGRCDRSLARSEQAECLFYPRGMVAQASRLCASVQ